ncbi:glycosyltransferase family 4 protein [Verrucomicrobia bacterium]|nr:glycosyltransferase family 4 protein [Verrucomicrobiota bacterium]
MNKNKEITFLIGALHNGGQERQVLNLIAGLNEKGFNTHLIIWTKFPCSEKALERFLFSGIRLTFLKGLRLSKLWQLRKYIKKTDIVHCYTFHLNFLLFVSGALTKVKIFGGLRGQIEYYKRNMSFPLFVLNFILPKCIITNSEVQYTEDLKFLEKLAPKFKVIENGVAISSKYKVKPNLGKRCIDIFCVSRLIEEKKIDYILKACSKLEGCWVLHIIGDGPKMNSLIQYAHELGIREKVKFHGEIGNVYDLIKDFDIFVLLSNSEGISNAILEANGLGKPCVVTNVGDNYKIIKNNKNGFLINKGDVKKAEESLQKLLDNQKLLFDMGESGYEHVKKQFSITKYIDETLKCYEQN